MTTAILDTNVVVQHLIGSRHSASYRCVESLYEGRFRLSYSPATLKEYVVVLMLPTIRVRHGLSDSEILVYISSLLVTGDQFPGSVHVSAATARDLTDSKFLSLAVESRADYLVTNDRRHLLPIKRYGETRIVTPAAFLRALR